MSRTAENIVSFAIIAAMVYIGIAFSSYRFRHPDMTETRILLNAADVLRWR